MAEVQVCTVNDEELPEVLKRAISDASTQQSIARIAYREHHVAIVNEVWVPLILKLANERFKRGEINLLIRRLEHTVTTKEAAEVIANWAKGLT